MADRWEGILGSSAHWLVKCADHLPPTLTRYLHQLEAPPPQTFERPVCERSQGGGWKEVSGLLLLHAPSWCMFAIREKKFPLPVDREGVT